MCAALINDVSAFPKATPDDLIIIGGGSTATTLLIRLNEAIKKAGGLPKPIRLHCFDPKGFPNGGIAYGACSPHHILNSVRTEMSPWRSEAFHEYCLDKDLGTCKNTFNPRADYASFLRVETAAVIRELEGFGVTLHQHRSDVRISKSSAQGFDITEASTRKPLLVECRGAQIVIAAGYGPNNHFDTVRRDGSPHYLHSLYEGGNVLDGHPITQKEAPHIVFIGNGPALYDFVNDLHGNHLTRARLTILSGASNRALSIRDLGIEENEKNIIPHKMLSLSRYAAAPELRRAILRDFHQAASPRRAALDILKNIKQVLGKMECNEALRFQQSNFIGWLKHTATPVPQSSHNKLIALRPDIIQCRVNEDALSVQRDHIRVTTAQKIIEADLVVNGTGHGRHNAPVLEQMKNDKLAFSYAGFDALETEPNGYQLAGSKIACIGPATHVGCDGVESFDIYAQNFAKDYVSGRFPAQSGQVLTFPQP